MKKTFLFDEKTYCLNENNIIFFPDYSSPVQQETWKKNGLSEGILKLAATASLEVYVIFFVYF